MRLFPAPNALLSGCVRALAVGMAIFVLLTILDVLNIHPGSVLRAGIVGGVSYILIWCIGPYLPYGRKVQP